MVEMVLGDGAYPAEVTAEGNSRQATRDYYDHCDQSVHITVNTLADTRAWQAATLRMLAIGIKWAVRWLSCTALFLGAYLALGIDQHYGLPLALIGGVALGNLVRYVEWLLHNRKGLV